MLLNTYKQASRKREIDTMKKDLDHDVYRQNSQCRFDLATNDSKCLLTKPSQTVFSFPYSY